MGDRRLWGGARLNDAADAHTNLAMFYAIIALAESGCFIGSTPHADLSRIIKICKAAAQKQLRLFDKNAAALAKAVSL